MKAAQINEYGDASVVKAVETDKPTVKENQVLVRVAAASLNPFDSTVRAGYVQEAMPLQLPVTLGGDIAGEVIEVGEKAGTVAVGDKVFGQASVFAGNSGAFAEYAATSVNQVAKAPSNVDLLEAAALPLVGVSALQAIAEHIGLQAGQKILITGGAGSIGRIAVQIAKQLGAYVAATATGEGIAIAKAAGADEVIDYKSQDYTELLSGYDAAFDTAGKDELNKMVKVLKGDGIAVSMAGQPAEERQLTTIAQSTKVTTAKLDQLRELVETGVVTPGIGKVFSLDDVQAAFEARDSGAVAGKVVLEIA